MTDVGQRVVRDVRNQLFGHILGQSAAFFARRTTGQLMSRITNDVNQVQQVGLGDDRRPAPRGRWRWSATPRCSSTTTRGSRSSS